MSDRVLRSCVVLFATLCLLALPSALPSRLGAAELQTLEIASKSGVHTFAVEMAVTPEEQPLTFWMKNTYVSLDMIFIRGDGRILHIAENTEPLSERMVPSGGSARAVLEVVAGTARKLGIAPGDRVAHPMFKER